MGRSDKIMERSDKVLDFLTVLVGWFFLYLLAALIVLAVSVGIMFLTNIGKKEEDKQTVVFQTTGFWILQSILLVVFISVVSWKIFHIYKERSH
jgi:heme/copper-type cytochrome/quinol oxidase subunit 2